jgi:hypothetical protein
MFGENQQLTLLNSTLFIIFGETKVSENAPNSAIKFANKG